MQKEALEAYLKNNNLDISGVYGYYEFNTGHRDFIYNNYYSGENFVLLSVTGISVVSGGLNYSNSSNTNNSGDIVSIYGEHKNIPFKISTSAGAITSAYIDAGNVGGNVEGNVAGNTLGILTGLYYETPNYSISNTAGTGAALEFKMYPNYDYGTRYDLNPFASVAPNSGVVSGAIKPGSSHLGSGLFSGRDCLKFSSGFLDESWTFFIDYKVDKSFAPGKSKILLTSYDNWNLPSGFAVTIDDGNHLNFEYRDASNNIQSFPADINLQECNLISVSKDNDSSSIILGKHDLAEEKHEFEKFTVSYNKTKNLYVGGFKNGIYSNASYTGFSGYVNEILFLNQSCNSEQLQELSNLFSVTGYTAATTGLSTTYFPIVTGIDVSAQVIASSGNVGYDLRYNTVDGVTGYYPSGIVSGITESGTVLYYDPINSGQSEDYIAVQEKFYINEDKKKTYAPKILSFETKVSDNDIFEMYSFDNFDADKTSNLEVNFSSSPGKLYFQETITGSKFNLYENGVYQVSGEDYSYNNKTSIVDSNSYAPYSNAEDESMTSSLPNESYTVSGFTFIPTNGQNYTYSNFPLSLSNSTGYLLYLNGQKLVSGAAYDYDVVGSDLVINNSSYNYESGKINIAGIRSGASRNYIKAYQTVGSDYYVTGYSYNLIDEMIFLNGQRLKQNVDYLKVSSGSLTLRNANVDKKTFPFFTGETNFFNV